MLLYQLIPSRAHFVAQLVLLCIEPASLRFGPGSFLWSCWFSFGHCAGSLFWFVSVDVTTAVFAIALGITKNPTYELLCCSCICYINYWISMWTVVLCTICIVWILCVVRVTRRYLPEFPTLNHTVTAYEIRVIRLFYPMFVWKVTNP